MIADVAQASSRREDHGADVSMATVGEGDGGRERNSIFDGYHVESKDGDAALTFDLPSGKQWRKRIWPRKYHPRKLLHRWNTAEEIVSYLISFEQHEDWISTTIPQTSPSGTILFFDRKKTPKYRSDGYDWKTRRTSAKQVREDRLKLKVAGYQLLYGCYAHSASNPDFHRRSYWLIQNPNLIMVHYLETGTRCGPSDASNVVSLQEEDIISPSNWDMLSISDCNLCAILDMASPGECLGSIVSQLAKVLTLNLQRASSLEEAIEINNNGLPVDKYEESRSKKVKTNLKDVENSATSDANSESSLPLPIASKEEQVHLTNGNGIPAAISPNSNSPLSNSKDFLQVLSKSPHIIVCYPQNGPMSYVLTLPTAANKSAYHATILNATPDKDGKLPLPPSGTFPYLGERTEVKSEPGCSTKKKGTAKGGSKGKERVTMATSSTITKVLSSLLRNAEDRKCLDTPSPQEKRNKDYNPECFSEFAKGLLTMNPLEAGRVDESGPSTHYRSNKKSPRPNSYESSNSELTDSLGRESACGNMSSGMATSNGDGEKEMESMDLVEADALYNHDQNESNAEMSFSENNNPSTFSASLATLVSELISQDPLPTTCSTTAGLHSHIQTSVEAQRQQSTGGINSGVTTSIEGMGAGGNNIGTDHSALLQVDNIPDIALDLDSDTLQKLLQVSFSPPRHNPNSFSSYSQQNQMYEESVTPEAPLSPISRFIDSLSPPTLDSEPSQPLASNHDHLLNRNSAHNCFQSNFSSNSNSAGPLLEIVTDSQCNSLNASSVEVPPVVPNVVVMSGENNDWSSWDANDTHSIEQWLESTSNDADFTRYSPMPTTSDMGLLRTTTTVAGNHSTTDNQLQSFVNVPEDSFTRVDNHTASSLPPLSSLLEPQSDTNHTVHRKISNSSVSSEPVYNMPQPASSSQPYGTDTHLSLPNLVLPELNTESSSHSGYSSPITGGRISSPIHNMSTVSSPSALQDIPEGIQMELENSIPSYMQYDGDPLNLFDYRSGSPAASSPSLASVSSRSTVSIQDSTMFDSDAPSVVELCEMLSESANVKHHDFSHMTLTENEQHQLYSAAQVIQSAFRKYKVRRQTRDKEKSAALLIENYYKKYREVKQQKEQAARRIQQQYRVYKNRTRELNRAAACVQQMYRYHQRRQQGMLDEQAAPNNPSPMQ